MSKKIQFLMVAIALASPTSQAVPQEIFSDFIEYTEEGGSPVINCGVIAKIAIRGNKMHPSTHNKTINRQWNGHNHIQCN